MDIIKIMVMSNVQIDSSYIQFSSGASVAENVRQSLLDITNYDQYRKQFQTVVTFEPWTLNIEPISLGNTIYTTS